MQEAQLMAALDTQQLAAARHLRGPVAILAGAGSGKTRTITHRIAHGINSGAYNPEKVLALTYTRKAALELQQRLAQLGAPDVTARTFHSLALEQLHEFWPQVIGGKHPEIIAQKLPLLQQAAAQAAATLSKASLVELAAEIEWRKVSLLSFAEYESVAENRLMFPELSNAQAVEIMRSYEELKTLRKAIDLEDVIALMAGMIASEQQVAAVLRQRYRFFTVDEYQDISPLQHALLQEWLGPDNQDLCVVGDPAQTIFSFAGADSNFLLEFKQQFPAAKVIKLRNNYRSLAPIIECANRLNAVQPGGLQLTAINSHSGEAVRAAAFGSIDQEAASLAAAVRGQIDAGHDPDEIAVLARTNAQLELVAKTLKGAGVSVRTPNAPSFFAFPAVKQSLVALRAAALSPSNKPVLHVISDVLQVNGWRATPYAEPEQETVRQQLDQLWDLITAHCDGQDLLKVSDTLLELAASGVHPGSGQVTLLPIHSAKGLEWDTVYVLGLNEGVLPIKQSLHDPGLLAEERRLAYVAFTRARKILRVSLLSEAALAKPSRFLSEAGIPITAIS